MPLNTLSAAINGRYKFMMNNKCDNYKNVTDADNLFAAYKAARQGCTWKGQVQKYSMDFLFNLRELQKELESGTYKDSEKREFVLRERGKTRLIRASAFKDRIVRHSLCDNVLTPALKPYLIYDNCASLKGRGVTMARNRLKVHLHRFYRKYQSNEGYILLMDFSSYYDNVRHDLLLAAVKKHIKDERILKLLEQIIAGFRPDVSFLSDEEAAALYHGKYKALNFKDIPRKLKTGEKYLDKSMDIGDQSSQILSVFFPTPIDNLIKIVEGEPFYGRYMDDSYIISRSKERLKYLLERIKVVAAELGIIINERKTRIVKLSRTFRYMQNKYFLTETGKVVERANPQRITAMRRKMKRLEATLKSGRIQLADVERMYSSWRGNYYRIMSKAQRLNIDNAYNKLIGGRQNEAIRI